MVDKNSNESDCLQELQSLNLYQCHDFVQWLQNKKDSNNENLQTCVSEYFKILKQKELCIDTFDYLNAKNGSLRLFDLKQRNVIPKLEESIIQQEELQKNITEEESLRQALEQLDNFNMQYLRYSKNTLMKCVLEIFKRAGLVDKFNINLEKLQSLLLKVAKSYNQVPYHNFAHAFNILHIIYYIYSKTNIKDYLQDIDRLAIFVGALCHDINHEGVNNQHYQKLGTISAQVVNDKSILEHYHSYQMFHLIQQDQYNIVENLTQQDKITFRKIVIEAILNTDMTLHQGLMQEFEQIIVKKQNNEFNLQSLDDRIILAKTLVHFSDISGPTSDFKEYKEWGLRITQEFHDQYESEIENPSFEGQRPMEFMKYTDHLGFCKSQIFFASNLKAFVNLFFRTVSQVLQRKPEQRSMHEIQEIIPFFKQIQFFKEKEIKDSFFAVIIQSFKFERYSKKSILFQIGDFGDKFYIILKGKVSVLIPNNIKNIKKQSINSSQKSSIKSSIGSGGFLNRRQSQDCIDQQPTIKYEKILNENYTEVKQIDEGNSFGELALISSKPRAATIRCIEECEFATLTKEEYLKSLAKIDEKSNEERIQFFQQTPYFRKWSRAMLNKLLVCFNELRVIKNQILLEEEQSSQFLFLIKEGEFQLSRRVLSNEYDSSHHQLKTSKQQIDEQKKNALQKQQISKIDEKSYFEKIQSSSIKKNASISQNKQGQGFLLLGKGQLFGEECLILGIPALYTIKCNSISGKVLAINELEFIKKIKSQEETFRIFEQVCQQKLNQITQSMVKNKKIKEKIEQFEKQLSNKQEDTNEQIDKKQEKQYQGRNPSSKVSKACSQVEPSLIQDMNVQKQRPLLNRREIDKRQSLIEIVNEYPNVQEQKQLIKKEYQKKIQQLQEQEKGKQNVNIDSKQNFKEQLAQILYKSNNKKEFISIFKRKLVAAAQNEEDDPQQHLKLLDNFLRSSIVKKYTQAQKKHYISSKVGEAIEQTEGYSEVFSKFMNKDRERNTSASLTPVKYSSRKQKSKAISLNVTNRFQNLNQSPNIQTTIKDLGRKSQLYKNESQEDYSMFNNYKIPLKKKTNKNVTQMQFYQQNNNQYRLMTVAHTISKRKSPSIRRYKEFQNQTLSPSLNNYYSGSVQTKTCFSISKSQMRHLKQSSNFDKKSL